MRRLALKRASSGFTLIELIITIVIIGVLAAVAIPKFQNLSGDAEKGVASGVASSIASASSVNYSRSKVPGAVQCGAGVATPAGCTYYAIASCGDLNTNKAFLADIPTGYTVTDSGTTVLTNNGTSVSGCTVTGPAPASVVSPAFSAYGA